MRRLGGAEPSVAAVQSAQHGVRGQRMGVVTSGERPAAAVTVGSTFGVSGRGTFGSALLAPPSLVAGTPVSAAR